MDSAAPSVWTDSEQEEGAQEKKGKKKRRTKKKGTTARKQQAKAAEEARLNHLKQKQEYLRDTKARVQAEWEANHMKAEVYVLEYEAREEALREASERLEEIEKAWQEFVEERRKAKEWEEYMNCNGRPNPSSMREVNSYMYVWTELDWKDKMSDCIRKTAEVIELLHGMEEIINDPGMNAEYVKDMKELRGEVRSLLQAHIDRVTFYLFSRIDTEMVPVSFSTSKYFVSCPYFSMGLWADTYTPISASRGKEVRKPLKIRFDEMDFTVIIPVSLTDVHKVVRVMLLNYDHWSEKCRTYDCPSTPFYYTRTLNDLFNSEFATKREIIEYREYKEVLTKKKIAALPAEPTVSQEILAWDTTPQRAVSEEVMYQECQEEDNIGRQLKAMLNEYEINLRERTFLGELLLCEFLQQPPQSQCFRLKHCVTLRQEPPMLKVIDFYESPIPHLKFDLEEELERRDTYTRRRTSEGKVLRTFEEVERFVCIRMKVCESVIWYDEPEPANWDPVHGYWSEEDIHDVNYDKDQKVVTFKTGRVGLMGMHVRTYTLFPFEDWTFEPNEEGGVNFHLVTAITTFHFIIRECEVCLDAMENCPGEAMDWILGKYYTPYELMQHLKKGGIELFPAPDATTYIAGVKSKHVVIEKNIYQIWGMFSKCFRFKRSRFNQVAERGNIVFQVQEVYKEHQIDFCLVQTTMCSCFILDVNEESRAYTPDIAPGSENYVDLYTLLYKNSTKHAKRESKCTSYLEIQTVKEFLTSIRPLSFS